VVKYDVPHCSSERTLSLPLYYEKRHDNQVGAILNEPINLIQCTQNKSIVRTTWWWQKSLAPLHTWKSMLYVWLTLPLGRSTHTDVWLHYDGAAAHVILKVPDISHKHFLGHCTDSGSPPSHMPVSWPPNSYDVTKSDSSLWRIMQGWGCTQLLQQWLVVQRRCQPVNLQGIKDVVSLWTYKVSKSESPLPDNIFHYNLKNLYN